MTRFLTDDMRRQHHQSRGVALSVSSATADPSKRPNLDQIHDRAVDSAGDVPRILALARELGTTVPLPLPGQAMLRWEQLASLGAANLTVARIVEPHLDAVAILAEAEQQSLNSPTATWGVYAAQGPGTALTAQQVAGNWVLNGQKPWCSLAQELSHALVTAQTDAGVQLFAVELNHPGITSDDRPWRALGLPDVPSSGLRFSAVPAVAVGEPGWYLRRRGFGWGAVGVAAVWHGAATAVARRLYQHCLSRDPDQIALWHLGSADNALWAAKAAFNASAEAFSTQEKKPNADASALENIADITAARLRATVVAAAETVLSVAAHGMGPEPLAFDDEHAQRVADLELYLRQDHAERSLARLGQLVINSAGTQQPW